MKKIIHEIIDLGKGIYGAGYSQITNDNLLKIYDDNVTNNGGGTIIDDSIDGHVIIDSANNQMFQQPKLKFDRMVVTNDNVNQRTIVSRPAPITISTSAPTNPLVGDKWVNNTTWKKYIYYDNFWVEETTNLI